MADYTELTYCKVIGRYNGIVADTGDAGTLPDMYNVNVPVSLRVVRADSDDAPELRIVNGNPPRTILVTSIKAQIESGVLRLPGSLVDGVDIVAKSEIMDLGETPLLLKAVFGDVTINGSTFRFDPITTLLPTVERDTYTAGRVQRVQLTGVPTGGTWFLTYGGSPTNTLMWNATPLQVQTALRGLAAIGNNVTVSGTVGDYTVTFTGALAAANPYQLGQSDDLAGGMLPSVKIWDTYAPAIIDLTTADRVLTSPSTPSTIVARLIPDDWAFDEEHRLYFTSGGQRVGVAKTPPFDEMVAEELTEQVPPAVGAELDVQTEPTVLSFLSALGISIIADPDNPTTHIRVKFGTATSAAFPASATTVEALTNATAVGRAVVKAVDKGVARAAIDAANSQQLAVNVKDPLYGAVGDGSTDDTVAVQAAIDAAAARPTYDLGGNFQYIGVFFPAGKYVVSNLTVPGGVTLYGDGASISAKPGTTGHLITLEDGMMGGLRNLRVSGYYTATDDLGGVHITSGRKYASIVHCTIDFFRRRAILCEGPSFYLDVGDGLLEGWRGDNSDLATYSGVLELTGSANDAQLLNTEINGSRYHEDPLIAAGPTSASLYACALVIKGGAGNQLCRNLILEQADTGAYIDNTSKVLMSGVRSELNYGHGFLIGTGNGRLSDCQALDNSKNGDNLFDGFHFSTDSNFACVNLTSISEGAVKHRYGIYDGGTNPIVRRQYINPRSTGDHIPFGILPGVQYGGPAFGFPTAHSPVAISGATPDITGQTWLRANDSSTITNFLGTVNGQKFYIRGNGTMSVAYTADIATLKTPTVLKSGVWYEFVKLDGIHYERDPSSPRLIDKTLYAPIIAGGPDTITITAGWGTPEGVVTAVPGSLFLRGNGSTGTTFYVKESGSGSSGWVAK